MGDERKCEDLYLSYGEREQKFDGGGDVMSYTERGRERDFWESERINTLSSYFGNLYISQNIMCANLF